jgi:hypothetical protein
MRQSTLDEYQSTGVECEDCGETFENIKVHHGMTKCGPTKFKETLTCEFCGGEFEKYESKLKRKGRGTYCSEECHNQAQKTGEERQCKQCGEGFYRPDCHLNRERGGKNHGCFCSPECHIEWRVDTGEFRGSNHPVYKGGGRLTSIVRTLLSEQPWTTVRSEYRSDIVECESCGCQTDRELDVHHVIPVASGGTNNDALLMALCRSCHFKADRFIEKYTEPHLVKYAQSNGGEP